MIGTVSHPLMSRRQAMAALASTAALPLVSACASDRPPSAPAVAGAGADEVGALALLDSCADHLLRLAPESATSLGLDTGARAALRSQLADRSAEGQQARGGATPRRSGARQRLQHHRTVACHAHQLRGGAQRLRDGARGFRTPVWRHHGRWLAQHAVCRHPERRRLSRRPAVPRQRSPHRERRGRRGVSRPAAVVCQAARRRAWPHGGGARRRAGAAGVPDRQGAGADAPLGKERARRRHARRVPGAANEDHRRHRGPSARGPSRHRRSRPRSTGSCRNCRPSAASPPTTPASRRVRTARSSTGGR